MSTTPPPTKSSRILCGLLALFLWLIIIALIIPATLGCRRASHRARIINNIKQIGIALYDFDYTYDHYPQPGIPEELLPQYPQKDRTDSNYLLGQLIAGQCTDTELIFEMGHSTGREFFADDIFEKQEDILRAGESEVIYISAMGDDPLSSGNTTSDTPIVLALANPGTTTFDTKYLRGEAVYLRGDSSVALTKLNKNGLPLLKGQGQKTLFDTGPDTIWGDAKPQIHYPLPYPAKTTSPDAPRFFRSKQFQLFIILGAPIVLFYLICRLDDLVRRQS
ncbi:MAG: hypothetical protein ACSHYF_14805 [Verrucomicrobiaceae bacterium]